MRKGSISNVDIGRRAIGFQVSCCAMSYIKRLAQDAMAKLGVVTCARTRVLSDSIFHHGVTRVAAGIWR